MTEETIQMEPTGKKTDNALMAILSYIGPLVIVSYIVAKDDPFVKFHIKQGLVLIVVEVALWFTVSMFPIIWPLWQLLNLAIFILAIIGIINAAQGKEKELPVVGKFAKQFPI
jgi:uncharacterized membrane protein